MSETGRVAGSPGVLTPGDLPSTGVEWLYTHQVVSLTTTIIQSGEAPF